MNNFIVVLGLIKSLTPYIKKHLISQLAYHEFLLINNAFIIFFVSLISCYHYFYKKETYGNLKKLDINNFFVVGVLAFLTICSSYILSKIDFNNVGLVSTIIKLFSNITVLGLGFLLFNETLTKFQIIGVIFSIIGIYLTNKK